MKKSELKDLIKECIDEELNEQSLGDKFFKLWFGKSKEDIVRGVKKLSDKDLISLAKSDWSNTGGAAKVQGDAISAEMKRRNLK